MNGSSFVLTQLLGQSPTLLVYVVGICLAIAFRRRSPAASSLVLIGATLLLTLAVGWTLVMQWAINNGSMASIARYGIVLNLFFAAGHALFIAAAFVGRREARESGFEVRPVPVAPVAPPPLP